MADLTSLYRGALLGQALSKQLGVGLATGEDVNLSIRTALIQSGVASGRVNPASLSSSDASLLGTAVKPPHVGSSSVLGDVLGAVATPFKIAGNTAADLVSAAEGLPQGLATVGEAAYRSLNPLANSLLGTNYPTPKGPNLGDVISGIAKSTVHDFTHFDPMHPLFPLLDVAAIVGGGAGALARAGRLSGLAAAGRAARAGEEAGALGRFANWTNRGRPPIVAYPQALEHAVPGTQMPSLEPLRFGSVSPFRRLFVEKPIDALFQTRLAQVPLKGFPASTSLSDLRTAYNIRKMANVTKGRVGATAQSQSRVALQDFNQAMHALIHESANQAVASEKFDALVLARKLGALTASPEDRLALLDAYRDKVLLGKAPPAEALPDVWVGGELVPAERVPGKAEAGALPETIQGKRIREFYANLTGTDAYRNFFAHPTEGMVKVQQAMDRQVVENLRTFNINPHEVLQHSLGPAAFLRDRSAEELLREQPANVQAASDFARQAYDLEQELKKSKGHTFELALIPQLAKYLPGEVTVQEKVKLLEDAVDSLKADINGEHTPRELLNNAEGTGYLPGRTLAQKVAVGVHDRFGVNEAVAENFAVGGLTNYFPEASALHMMVRPNGGPISRTLNRIRHPTTAQGGTLGLHEFKRENTARMLNANTMGVAPFASFLKEADMSAFKAGVDRRDPVTFVRHISQRERVLAHRMLSEPMIHSIVMKDAEGNPLMFANDAELLTRLGDTAMADKWRLLPVQAIRTLVQTEDQTGFDLAGALRDSHELTPALMDHFDRVVDESAQSFIRHFSDEAITSRGRMVAVPSAFVDNLIRHAKILDSARGPGHLWQAFINRWRTAVLAYMPSWLIRTTIGHGFIMFLGGVWNPVHYIQSVNYFKNGWHLPGSEISLSRGLERTVPGGIEQGAPHSEFGLVGEQHALRMNAMAQATTHGVHRIMNFQRRTAFLSKLNTVTNQHFAELGEAFKFPHGFRNARNIDDIIQNHPDWVHHALNELDRVSYTFGQMAPWERRLAKNILPFWGWYKFVSKFVWSLPFTYPGRALAVSRLGEIGQSNQDALGPMPGWLHASLMYDTHDLTKLHYLSMLGLNPLGDVMNPAGGFQGIVRLGQMSPVMQAVLEGMGYNTLTGGLEAIDPSSGIVEVNGKFVNVNTGKQFDSLGQASVSADLARFFGGLLRSFPEIRIAETAATGGRPVYPESIPFVAEHRIPTTNLKDVSPEATALQYLGIAPKTYNLQKYQATLASNLRRALGTQRKAIAKEKALP